jgi:hypothetical protein
MLRNKDRWRCSETATVFDVPCVDGLAWLRFMHVSPQTSLEAARGRPAARRSKLGSAARLFKDMIVREERSWLSNGVGGQHSGRRGRTGR